MPSRSPLASSAAALALTLLLAACSTAPTGTPPASAATTAPTAAAAAPEDSRSSITGSRLPSKSTDRLVRTTGASGAKEMERDRPPSTMPRTN